MEEKIKIEFKELLRGHDLIEKKPEALFTVTTPSTVLFCTFQDLKCLYVQDIGILVGAITAIGVYFAIKSAIEKHHIKKIEAEKAENISHLHEGIREVYLNKKCKNK